MASLTHARARRCEMLGCGAKLSDCVGSQVCNYRSSTVHRGAVQPGQPHRLPSGEHTVVKQCDNDLTEDAVWAAVAEFLERANVPADRFQTKIYDALESLLCAITSTGVHVSELRLAQLPLQEWREMRVLRVSWDYVLRQVGHVAADRKGVTRLNQEQLRSAPLPFHSLLINTIQGWCNLNGMMHNELEFSISTTDRERWAFVMSARVMTLARLGGPSTTSSLYDADDWLQIVQALNYVPDAAFKPEYYRTLRRIMPEVQRELEYKKDAAEGAGDYATVYHITAVLISRDDCNNMANARVGLKNNKYYLCVHTDGEDGGGYDVDFGPDDDPVLQVCCDGVESTMTWNRGADGRRKVLCVDLGGFTKLTQSQCEEWTLRCSR